jgi:AraC-like DNA-binding protein
MDDLIALSGATIYPSHFHKRPEITYVLQGTCHSIIHSSDYTAEKDDILFASAYYPHSYDTSLDAKRYTLLPETNLESDILQVLEDKTFPCLLDDKNFNREKLLPLFEEAHKAQSSKGFMSPSARWLLLKGYTNIIYGRLLEGYGDRLVLRNKHINELVKILSYIEENCDKKLTLDELANQFGYNRYYFSKFFNSYIGDNLTNYINNTRVRKFIKLYEISPDKSLLNLALSVGFDSMPSFYRAFNRVYHCTPKEYFKRTLKQ